METVQQLELTMLKSNATEERMTSSQLKVGNLLVHIRCVDEDDKALGMAIQVIKRHTETSNRTTTHRQ